MEIRVELREIQLVESPDSLQVLVLGEVDGPRAFPIYIGQYEAIQLDMALHRARYPRPLTHDLVLNTIEAMGGTLDRIIVDDLRPMDPDKPSNETFFGKLAVSLGDGREVLVDSRPSDAIVLATKAGVPIYVEERVLERANRAQPDEEE